MERNVVRIVAAVSGPGARCVTELKTDARETNGEMNFTKIMIIMIVHPNVHVIIIINQVAVQSLIKIPMSSTYHIILKIASPLLSDLAVQTVC